MRKYPAAITSTPKEIVSMVLEDLFSINSAARDTMITNTMNEMNNFILLV